MNVEVLKTIYMFAMMTLGGIAAIKLIIDFNPKEKGR